MYIITIISKHTDTFWGTPRSEGAKDNLIAALTVRGAKQVKYALYYIHNWRLIITFYIITAVYGQKVRQNCMSSHLLLVIFYGYLRKWFKNYR